MGIAVELESQRQQVIRDVADIKLRPGQYLIRTRENHEKARDRDGLPVQGARIPYNGTAYGVQFRNNIAVIDDVSVGEIADLMLVEVGGDPTKLLEPFRLRSAERLARLLQSDFGYEIVPGLAKLPRLSRTRIAELNELAAEGGDDEAEDDEPAAAVVESIGAPAGTPKKARAKRRKTRGKRATIKAQPITVDGEGQRVGPSSGRKILGVDADAEVGGMPAEPR